RGNRTSNRLRALARKVQERERDDRRADLVAGAEDRPFDLDARVRPGELLLDEAERDHALERRRPRGAGRSTDLAAGGVDGAGFLRRAEEGGGGDAVAFVRGLQSRPVELHADEPALGSTPFLLGFEGSLPDEGALVQVDEPVQAELVRRVFLLLAV